MGTLRVRRSRAKRKTPWRQHKPVWVDPYPQIPGTHPEKLIFAALMSRGIYFVFQGDFPVKDKAMSVLLQARNFQPDFVLPEYKVILDPFGDYHHTLPDAIKSDFWKEIYYRGSGYEFVHPWSDDVERYGGEWAVNLSERIHHGPTHKLDKVDAMWKARQGYRLGPDLGAGTKGVAIANRKRRKPKPITIRRPR